MKYLLITMEDRSFVYYNKYRFKKFYSNEFFYKRFLKINNNLVDLKGSSLGTAEIFCHELQITLLLTTM